LLAGGLLYVAYSFVLYTFAIHFNSLFLVYCATLGVSLFALASLAAAAVRSEAPANLGRRSKLVAAILMALAAIFAALWLSEIIPALVSGVTPRSVAEVGMATNPVHVLDLSIVLPSMMAAGVALWRGRRLGALAAPPLLTFSALMLATVVVL